MISFEIVLRSILVPNDQYLKISNTFKKYLTEKDIIILKISFLDENRREIPLKDLCIFCFRPLLKYVDIYDDIKSFCKSGFNNIDRSTFDKKIDKWQDMSEDDKQFYKHNSDPPIKNFLNKKEYKKSFSRNTFDMSPFFGSNSPFLKFQNH